MRCQDKFKKGVVLISVIFVVLILSMLAVSVLFIMTNEARLTESQIRRIRAHYAAQAGIQHYMELLKSNPPPPVNIPGYLVDGISVDIDFFDPTDSAQGCPDDLSNPNDPACIRAIARY